MTNMKLVLEGELRAAHVQALDQFGAALRDVIAGRTDVEVTTVRASGTKVDVTMTITASKWGAAAEIGDTVIHDALEQLGFEYVSRPEDDEPPTGKTVRSESARLTLA